MRRDAVVVEVEKQLKLAGPLIAVCLLQFAQQMISVMFVGHLGELALASASMATSFAQVTGFSVMMGMGSALDTFCGQAFGAEQFSMLGIHMQRAMLVLMLVSIPIGVIWAFTGQILLVLGQDPEISVGAGVYARWLIPALFAFGLLQCHFRFLQSQNIVFPQMLTTGLTSLFHILLCWVLISKLDLGIRGAALANSISYLLNLVFLVMYINLFPRCKTAWTGLSRNAFYGILGFTRLAIPSALMICLESWSFELVLLLSGLLPNPKLEASVLSISLNTSTMIFMILFGLGAAISTRVSNELGAGRPQSVRLAVSVMLCIVSTEGLIVGIIIISVRNIWGKLYSNEIEVVKHVADILPLLALSHIIDGIQSVLSGTIRGCGRQKIGALINLGAYYIVGIPVSVLLAFVFHFKDKGLWIGILCALIVQDILYLVFLLHTKWEKGDEGSSFGQTTGQSFLASYKGPGLHCSETSQTELKTPFMKKD